jgi:hypothetical protein
MTAMSKVVSILAISAVLTLGGSHVFAKSSGGPSQVKTSGTSAAPSGSGARDNTAKGHGGTGVGCGHHCPVKPTPPGATGGNDPRGPNRGPGDPALHPK